MSTARLSRNRSRAAKHANEREYENARSGAFRTANDSGARESALPLFASIGVIRGCVNALISVFGFRILNFAHLLCRAQRRTKITQFVVDLVRSFDSLSNFFAEQRAIAFAQ